MVIQVTTTKIKILTGQISKKGEAKGMVIGGTDVVGESTKENAPNGIVDWIIDVTLKNAGLTPIQLFNAVRKTSNTGVVVMVMVMTGNNCIIMPT